MMAIKQTLDNYYYYYKTRGSKTKTDQEHRTEYTTTEFCRESFWGRRVSNTIETAK